MLYNHHVCNYSPYLLFGKDLSFVRKAGTITLCIFDKKYRTYIESKLPILIQNIAKNAQKKAQFERPFFVMDFIIESLMSVARRRGAVDTSRKEDPSSNPANRFFRQ
jgi:hypothetical protein